MSRVIYSFLLYCVSPLVILYLLFRSFKSKDYRQRWSERFGLKKVLQTDVLIHSVSMGETLAALPLIKAIRQIYPDLSITVTTTSPTGSAEVIKGLGDSVQHCYLPFDFSICVYRFLKQIRPKFLIIMETELWPNLIHFAAKMDTKLILANARLSEKSMSQYQKYSQLTLPMLSKLDAIATQSSLISQRFAALGVDKKRLYACGSLKFDLNITTSKRQEAARLRQLLKLNERFIWVAGSVHPGEFDDVLNAHKKLLVIEPNALLIMVPRHPEQFNAAAVAINTHQLDYIRRSESVEVTISTQVLLGDTMGELLSFYGAADQAFVGGTLIENGGHNPLEPAAFGLPVFVGPHYWDFAEIAVLLNEAGGLQFIDSANTLAAGLSAYIQNNVAYRKASLAALDVVDKNRGSLNRHIDLIESCMKTFR
ncbi:lipid IV(A) 3-deoxy-D-manno-octulosonic acid transferase [uncultured Shewanella sp.]|uniref:lipid IV(A) 3-deoxy-D-manno-octulosonic acid transferase n=1 Tax=uncultured Shewanella sp. TaxID=173975 RepID=UPI00260621C6|nr:lipid IV(A) 3-deoxy-D-manno-octulosonic acid transferase [uncultured Shewanella sp.]